MTKPARERRPAELTHWPSERRHQRPKIRGEAGSKISWGWADWAGLAVSRAPLSRGQPVAQRETENATVRRHPDPAPKCLLACCGKPGGRGRIFHRDGASPKTRVTKPDRQAGQATHSRRNFSSGSPLCKELVKDCRDEFPCRRARRCAAPGLERSIRSLSRSSHQRWMDALLIACT